MKLNRRQFLLLTAGLATGCQTMDDGGSSATRKERKVDAGPTSEYAADGVYNNFCDQGFFVIRQGDKLVALSAICTHRKCQLSSEPDHSFYCKCHGSTFDSTGHVTEGPAKRDLPILPAASNDQGHLIVNVPVT